MLRLESHATNRVVLFDSPPLLLTNEARVLTSLVGQIVLVVRAGVTPQQAVLEAIGYIGEDKPIGLVLNQSKASRLAVTTATGRTDMADTVQNRTTRASPAESDVQAFT